MSTISNAAAPVAPTRELPENDWEHFRLYKDVREAIACLPIYFRTETHISRLCQTGLDCRSSMGIGKRYQWFTNSF